MFNIESLKSLGEPLKTFNYEVFIPQVPGNGIDGSNVRFYVDQASLPAVGTEQVSVFAGGHELRYAGRGIYPHEWTIGMRAYENRETLNMLTIWHNLQWDRINGTQNVSDVYKTTVFIQLNDSAGGVSHRIRMIGAFIANIGDVPLSPDSSNAIIVPVTFAYDYFVTEV